MPPADLEQGPPVRLGEWIAIEVTPAAGIDIAPLFLESPNLQPGNLAGYGAMSMRFRLDAVASAERVVFPDGAPRRPPQTPPPVAGSNSPTP